MSDTLSMPKLRPFGLRPGPRAETIVQREAARDLLRAIEDGVAIKRFGELEESTKVVMEMFFLVGRRIKPDWLLTYGALSHPSTSKAVRNGKTLKHLARMLQEKNAGAVADLLHVLTTMRLPARLENYLAATRRFQPVAPSFDANWLFLLRSSTDRGILFLGTVEGPIETALAEMDEINPDYAPYGVAAAWRVEDVDRAFDVAEDMLKEVAIGDDFYSFVDLQALALMKTQLDKALSDAKQLVAALTWESKAWPYTGKVAELPAELMSVPNEQAADPMSASNEMDEDMEVPTRLIT